MALPAIAMGISSAYSAIPEGRKAQLGDWLKNATGKVIGNATQAKALAGSSEKNAVIVAEGLVRAGAPASVLASLFDRSANAAAIKVSLISLGRSLLTQEDSTRPGLSASVPDTANDLMRAQLCRTLVRAFGSVENARRVQMALATLRSEDFEWFTALNPSVR